MSSIIVDICIFRDGCAADKDANKTMNVGIKTIAKKE